MSKHRVSQGMTAKLPSPAALAPVQVPTPKWWPFLRAALVLLTLWPVLLVFAPSVLQVPKYEVSGGQIVARSIASSTVIPAGTPVEAVTLHLSKTVGTAGAGYSAGRFASERGEVAVYGNDSRTGLLFGTRPPTFITPADPEGLLRAWRGGEAATFRPAPVPLTRQLWPLLFLLPTLGVIVALFFWKPSVTYLLSGDTLIVKTRASTTTFPRQETRASLTSEPLGARLFGTGMPGYHTGTFATKSGNVQAAATSARPVQALLLEHGGKRYYLTPSDPAAVAAWFGQG
ncbi:PH domain-containing protein [Deinococcus wulumuqiensis]|uniref:PH domain-containing protein n=1 Tax=Deinococcus wulumuqiensis TaxID=980427 RepID=UPI00242F8461|nr:PH domain-containing protein [Deinococcus wulumuqiensis]